MNDKILAWQPVSKRNVFSTRVFDITEITSRSPENTENKFFTLHATDWVIVIPVVEVQANEKSFLMVKQWRHGAEAMSIEFPGGVIEPGETPEEGAGRELLEETGYKAKTLMHAGSLSPNPAIMDNHCHIFIAENLENTWKTAPDDDEYIAVETIPVTQVIGKMGHGAYIHGLMSAALFLYIQKKGLPVQN